MKEQGDEQLPANPAATEARVDAGVWKVNVFNYKEKNCVGAIEWLKVRPL
jgi:hypothetical protein